MEKLHDLLGPWVASYPILSILAAFALGFGVAVLIFRKKKDH